MSNEYDHGLFPQSLLRFVATFQRLGAGELEAVRTYLASFRLPVRHSNALWRIEERLTAGANLGDELEAHPEVFPPWLGVTVRWGEKTGRLEQTLDSAARLADLDARVGRAISAALVYPAFLTTVGLSISCLFLTTVMPQFVTIARMSVDPSMPTPFDRQWPALSLLNTVVRAVAWHGDAVAVGLLGGWFWLLATWALSWMPGHARLLELVERAIPGVRPVRRAARGALQARLLSEGLAAGIPLDEALDRLAPLSADRSVKSSLGEASRSVRAGEGAAISLERRSGDDPLAGLFALALASPDVCGSLAGLSATLESAARDRLPSLGRAAVPILTMAVASIVAIAPLSCFVELMRLLSFLELQLR